MSYNILGVNPSHNGSVCLLSDGELILYLEEERLTKKKYDELPLKSILYILDKYSVDDIALAGINLVKTPSSFFKEPVENLIFRKLGFNSKNFYFFKKNQNYIYALRKIIPNIYQNILGIILSLIKIRLFDAKLHLASLLGALNGIFLQKSSYRPNLNKND